MTDLEQALQFAERAELAARKDLADCEARLAAAESAAVIKDQAIDRLRDRLAVAERVVVEARGYFQHHVSEAPHGIHVERVIDALASFDKAYFPQPEGHCQKHCFGHMEKPCEGRAVCVAATCLKHGRFTDALSAKEGE